MARPFASALVVWTKQEKASTTLVVHLDFQLNDRSDVILVELVVKRTIAAGDRFEFIIEVGDDLIHWKSESQKEAVSSHRFGFVQGSPLVGSKSHDRSEEVRRGHDMRGNPRLFNKVDGCRIGIVSWVIDMLLFSI